jgi:hypothetical protein
MHCRVAVAGSDSPTQRRATLGNASTHPCSRFGLRRQVRMPSKRIGPPCSRMTGSSRDKALVRRFRTSPDKPPRFARSPEPLASRSRKGERRL